MGNVGRLAGALARRWGEDEAKALTAGLLHDCGKVTTPVHVVDKATKLETLFDRIRLIDTRLEVLKRDAQIAALRQQLLNNQFQMGVQLSGIGDQIALGAIRTGLQADQYVANLQQNYFSNLARVLGGYAPQGTQQATPQG